MSIYHSIPIYAIRDVYVAGSLFFSRTIAFFRYRRVMRSLDAFPTPTQQELDAKTDNTCIVCREELYTGAPEGTNQEATAPPADIDTSNGPPKRLPCGHVFHRNCLRSWFERQLTCPTCRRRVDDQQARVPGAAGIGGGIGGGGALPGNNAGGDAARQQANAGGGLNIPRGALRNGPAGAHATEVAPLPLREPLRFEGFYIQPGAFVPWVGGALLPRDPTQTTAPGQPSRTYPQPQQQQTQRPRHTPAPSGTSVAGIGPSVNLANITTTAASATPTPPVIQSPPPTATTAPSWTTTFATGLPPPPTPTTTAPATATTTDKAKPSVSKPAGTDDEDTSSDDSEDLAGNPLASNAAALQDKRRMAAEAILRRFNSTGVSRSGTPGGSGAQGKMTGVEELQKAMEKASSKYFAVPPDAPTDAPSKPAALNAPRPSVSGVSPFPAQYHVRTDAPAFIPLFHMFHQQHFGPVMGTSRAWPTQQQQQQQQQASSSAHWQTQTLPFPPALASPFPQPPYQPYGSSVTTPRRTARPLGLAHTASTSSVPQQRSSSLLPRESRPESAAPTQDVLLQQLDSITRQQVEERLKVLENVKRMTQACIEELLAVKGSMPPTLARTRSTDARPAEPVATVGETVALEPAPVVATEPTEGLGLVEGFSPFIQEPATPLEIPSEPKEKESTTLEVAPVDDPAAENATEP